MDELQGNIEAFNAWVRSKMSKLTARGEECQDIMLYLLKAYMRAPDEEFRAYIKDKNKDYEEGDLDLTAEPLLVYASNKYHARVQSKEWSKPTQEKQDIVALTAKIATLHKQVKTKKGHTKEKEDSGSPRRSTWNGKQRTQKSNKQAEDSKKWAWKLVPPKEGEPQSKVVKGKTYHFCPNHKEKGMWTLHKPSECTQKHKKDEKASKEQPSLMTQLNLQVTP